ncbi:unnamed protein product [Euphydryas editha]|uniref:Uncharacterized protein n=1 Tax=Euphydryas editha TaxID=104508 RepID=A0AAU9V633_EUPED|nr:unnamed protein product [Euphydryas editha]
MLQRSQRIIAIHVIRGYRTFSCEAACVLFGFPPGDLEAEILATVFHKRAQYQHQGINFSNSDERRWKFEAETLVFGKCKEPLAQSSAGHVTIEAIRTVFREWIECQISLTFHLVQVLSGHCCFGRNFERAKNPGPDLPLPVLVKFTVKSERSWNSTLAFCESVMRQKERIKRNKDALDLVRTDEEHMVSI